MRLGGETTGGTRERVQVFYTPNNRGRSKEVDLKSGIVQGPPTRSTRQRVLWYTSELLNNSLSI